MDVLRGAGPVHDAGRGSGRDVPGAASDTRWLDLRAAADDRARSAATERLMQVAGSALTVAVEHVDVLVLPA